LFAGDKFLDLQPDDRCAAFFLLAFLVDFAAWPLDATLTAIEGLTEATEASRTIRRFKRYCAVLAMVLVVAAGIVVIVGRAHALAAVGRRSERL
jgi:hypothetical protein